MATALANVDNTNDKLTPALISQAKRMVRGEGEYDEQPGGEHAHRRADQGGIRFEDQGNGNAGHELREAALAPERLHEAALLQEGQHGQ